MAKQMKWPLAIYLALFGVTFTSCSSGSDDDEPTPDEQSSNPAYSMFDSQSFPKEWMVEKIEYKRGVLYELEYDAKGRPEGMQTRGRGYKYTYDGNSCTFIEERSFGADEIIIKGYFDGNKLIKVEWRNYIVTNVVYEGERLVKGSNGYRLTWDSNGNITNYTDDRSEFTYTDIPNRANVDFNMVMISLLADCWCDDGSEYFTLFGWTGARTRNLVKTLVKDYSGQYEFAYTLDSKGRPVKIDKIDNGEINDSYTITYVAG